MEEENLYVYKAIVIKVIDGDTIDLNVDLGFNLYMKDRFRFARINAPEKYGQNKILGQAALEFVKKLCPIGSSIMVKTEKEKGKYGRWIAEIYVNDENLNDLMVKEGHAIYYKY